MSFAAPNTSAKPPSYGSSPTLILFAYPRSQTPYAQQLPLTTFTTTSQPSHAPERRAKHNTQADRTLYRATPARRIALMVAVIVIQVILAIQALSQIRNRAEESLYFLGVKGGHVLLELFSDSLEFGVEFEVVGKEGPDVGVLLKGFGVSVRESRLKWTGLK